MAAWPGGNCPDCGDFMPPNLITCQTCRAMLNSELKVSVVDIPDFIPLQELDECDLEKSDTAIIAQSSKPVGLQVLLIEPRGVYYKCPGCNQELKIPKQFMGAKVQCNHCSHNFQMDLQNEPARVAATYVDCPYCQQRIRASKKMNNHNVQCLHCQGALHIKFQPQS